MVWVRLDDSFCEHPKVKLLSPAAFRLHVEALCYCGRTLSEGFVPKPFVEGREAPAAELSRTPTGYEHGLWEEKADGWVIHDFLEYNPSRAQVKHGRKVTSKRVKRWRNAKRNAVTNADVTAPRTRPVPVPVPSGSEAEASSPGATRRKRRSRATPDGIEHKAGMEAVWAGFRAVFGADPPPKSGPHWAAVVASLRQRGATTPQIRRAAERYAVLCRESNGMVPFKPSGFEPRFHGLLNGAASATKTRDEWGERPEFLKG